MNRNSKLKAYLCAGAMAASMAGAETGRSARSFQDHEVVTGKELLITDLAVVESEEASYPGPWSFGYLIEQSFGKDRAAGIVEAWLDDWLQGDEDLKIPARPGLAPVVAHWKKQDGYDPDEGVWEPNFANAPFRLLAIVNRMDLSLPFDSLTDERGEVKTPAVGPGYYGSSVTTEASAGEGRFVFGVIDENGKPLGTTLILEFALDNGRTQEELVHWAMDWHELGKHNSFDAEYRKALVKLTDRFVKRRSIQGDQGQDEPEDAAPTLLRIRSNDGAFGKTREFREFVTRGAGGPSVNAFIRRAGIVVPRRELPPNLRSTLVPGFLPGTPKEIFFRKGTRENSWLSRALRQSQGQNRILTPTTARADVLRSPILNLTLPAVADLKDKPTLGTIVAPVPGNDADYHWDARAVGTHSLRRAFSMQTCCGCHCGDTGTQFFHIAPREKGKASVLSKYLVGDGKNDVVRDPGSGREIKLQELKDRRTVFEKMLNPKIRRSDALKFKGRRAH